MTRRLYQLADDEIAEVRPGSISVVALDGGAREPEPIEVAWDIVGRGATATTTSCPKRSTNSPGP